LLGAKAKARCATTGKTHAVKTKKKLLKCTPGTKKKTRKGTSR
jgi:hypothetical protein